MIDETGGLTVGLEGIPLDWTTLPPAGLVTLIIIMMLTGKLHTNTAYQAMVKVYEAERAANVKLMDANTTLARALDKAQVYGEAGNKVYTAIQNEKDGVGT